MTAKCSGHCSNTLPETTLKMRTLTWPHQSAQSGKKMNSMKNVSILTQNIKLTHQNLTHLMSTLLVVQLWQFSQGTNHILNLSMSSLDQTTFKSTNLVFNTLLHQYYVICIHIHMFLFFQLKKKLKTRFIDWSGESIITVVQLNPNFPTKVIWLFLKYQPSDDDLTNSNSFKIKIQVL